MTLDATPSAVRCSLDLPGIATRTSDDTEHGGGGRYWIRTSDLTDVNRAL